MFASVLNAFESECRTANAAVREAGDDAMGRPTPCPPWTLKQLVVHLAVAVSRLPDMLEGDEQGVADTDAAGYYRGAGRFEPEAERARLDDAIKVAERFGTVDMVSAFLEEGWRRSAAAAASAGGTRVVRTGWGDRMTVRDFMLTRVIESAAHGRDIARALDQSPWTTPLALELARPVLVQLLEGDPPESLGWDEATFFDVATGRRGISDEERSALGPLAARLPSSSPDARH